MKTLYSTLIASVLLMWNMHDVKGQEIIFEEVTDPVRLNFLGVSNGSVDFADVNGNGYQDVLITGDRMAELYINDETGNFIKADNTPFPGIRHSTAAFADIDNDSNQDLAIAGAGENGFVTILYENDGSGNFTVADSLAGVLLGDIAFADVNGDGDQDLFVTGFGDAVDTAVLYENDGDGNFTEVRNTPFTGVSQSAVAFADIDGDGDEDLVISGVSEQRPVTELYVNDGDGNFTISSGATTSFRYYVGRGAVLFSDVDSDGDPDLMISGDTYTQDAFTALYLNDGDGSFLEEVDIPFSDVHGTDIAVADVNGNNSPDILIVGTRGDHEISELYLNDGSGGYTVAANMPFVPVRNGVATFADTDNDGNQELLIAGDNTGAGTVTRLYRRASCNELITDVVNTCQSYTWEVNWQTYTESGEYSETFTNIAGCDSTIMLELTINETDISVSQDGNELTANVADAAYQWLDCDDGYTPVSGEVNQTFIAFSSGSYAVQIIKNGCTDTSACYNVNILGKSGFASGNMLPAYPNPTTGKFTVDMGESCEHVEVLLKDLTGRIIKSEEYNSVRNLTLYIDRRPGMYFLEVYAPDGEKNVLTIIKK